MKIFYILLIIPLIHINAQSIELKQIDSLFAKGRYKLSLKGLEKQPESFKTNATKAAISESIDNYKKTAEFLEKALLQKESYKAKLKLA